MRGRTLGLARMSTAVLFLSLNAACATIGPGQPVHSDVPVGTGEQEQSAGDTVDVEQSGTSLTIRARELCNVHETREVSRTTTTPRENKSAWVDWTLGVGGAALVGAGVVTLIDSGNVSPADEASRTYNPLGGTGAVVLGAGLIAVGAAAATVALVDVGRASGSDESKDRVSLPGRELRRGVACKNAVPVADVELALLLPGVRSEEDERIALGTTGSDGVLRVDLERVVSDEFDGAEKAYVMREAVEVGNVDLTPVQAAHEASGWSKLDKAACAEPKKSDACAPVKAFLKKYPASTHATEGRLLVAKAQPAIEALEDDETWAGLDVDGCARPAWRDIEGADLLCDRVQQYVDAHPNGKHVAEAKAALAKGRPEIRRGRESMARAARDDEAAKQRREAAAAAEAKACPKRCAAICGGYERGTCISACERLECEIGADEPKKIPCMRRCAGMCKGGYGNTRCVGRCVNTECEVDPR